MAALIGVSWLRDDGDRGMPRAVATIERVVRPPKPQVPPALPLPVAPQSSAAAAPPVAAAALPAPRDDQEVEVQNGVRIIRPRRDRAVSGSQTLRVPDAAPGLQATPR